jgi:N-succinyldiaminopimelate aminotransferase
VFTAAERAAVAAVAVARDLLVISDEVYETLVYSDARAGPHVKLGTRPTDHVAQPPARLTAPHHVVLYIRRCILCARCSVCVATLPGMAERTVTVGSAGKSLSLTGWKIGWVVAPPALTRALWMARSSAMPWPHAPTQADVEEGRVGGALSCAV